MIEIELDGERHRVALRREGDRWIAGIAGREVAVSVVEVGGPGRRSLGERGWSMLIGPEAVSRKSYEVSFEGAAGDLVVRVNGIAVPLTVLNGRRRAGRPAHRSFSAGGRDAGDDRGARPLVAPMAGRVVKVLVKPGEAVAARQPLVVVEAMKMENELRAPRDGTVAEVRVSEGSSVEANTVLVVLSDASRSA